MPAANATCTCRFCGNETTSGVEFDAWVKPTFTDYDKLLPGEAICESCLFWFDETIRRVICRGLFTAKIALG